MAQSCGKFVAALVDPDFNPILDWPYWKRHNVEGIVIKISGTVEQTGPDTMANIARVFRDGDANRHSCRPIPFQSHGVGRATGANAKAKS